MSFATIRSAFETAIATAYGQLPTPVPVVFDNVQETPPDGEHVILSIGFPALTMPLVCKTEQSIELVRGSIQVSCYAPRGRGMKRLEELAAVGARALAEVHAQPDANDVRPRVGAIAGPVMVLSGSQPYALAVVSAPFTARG